MPMQMDEVTGQLKTNNMKLKGLVTKVGTHNVRLPSATANAALEC